MKYRFKPAFLIMLVVSLISSGIHGQDYSYSQFYANPLYLNPALSGAEYCPRINLNYRNQWPSLPGTFVSYGFSYDQAVDFLHGSVGAIVNYDKSGEASINRAGIGAMYNYHLIVSRNIVTNFALEADYGQRNVNWNDLVFGSQIDPGTGTPLPPAPQPQNFDGNVNYFDFSGGIVMGFDERYFLGVAVHHLTQPDISFFNESANTLKTKYTFHAGGNFGEENKSQQSSGSRIIISPNILYQQQGDFKHLNLGTYFTTKYLVTGIWYHHAFENPDALIVSLGITLEKLRFGYSYDYVISQLSNTSGGAHELSLAWIFNCEKKSKRPKAIMCPSF